jgi:hypothetical protein
VNVCRSDYADEENQQNTKEHTGTSCRGFGARMQKLPHEN